MAKKIAEVPLPKDNFLAGYKPVTPNFADDADETPSADAVPVPPEPSPKPQEKTPTGTEAEYRELYLARVKSPKKDCKIGIASKHDELLSSLVERLSTSDNNITKVDYLWNVLEHHFNTYGNTIRELINKTPPKNPFDNFK